MRLSYAVSLLPLAASVGALQVTSPKKGEDVDLSKSFTVKWDSVDTDPSSFDLYIVNNAVYPSVEQKIASDIDASKGSYDVSGLSDLTNGKGYQINFLSNSAKNSGILAQSQQFNVEGSSESTSTTTASDSKTTASATGTSTATTVSSSARASASASGSANSTSSGSTPVATGAGVSLAAPVSAAAGLLMGVLALNL
ncbi:Ser-Thr-rich glycosyl-phosphatidyl-inositol-anchored membrane family-domain-containing protein [Aspergillus pseudonomiae]|uniref:Ser-Thr-rich glycosyl-phosphatidyl-inositol-anchored membrane family-domain-containing protein n=1 Tax=Aspergillus pseudonomiae TaxID=1506151 RepID=A0A5N7D7H7_9EURO|nr:Ser-Thr-rich glycosyl-phosphatidyl-inositol-anchored membrane family-domain-containing protein [Aspergillus pseudonomiae]KAB8264751.1 Ser-Thr-rich glycosyl-phosphatidyl-inositol-anchored membrane family-domain-containing protein [Aspergillus pseudonomiae]KAE8401903.1 Ser-Thr-rich glycosyl-phosphatidyl-inositol-anchored membrane family-domain-containing protein [Aspergillus pseudonomiae]